MSTHVAEGTRREKPPSAAVPPRLAKGNRTPEANILRVSQAGADNRRQKYAYRKRLLVPRAWLPQARTAECEIRTLKRSPFPAHPTCE